MEVCCFSLIHNMAQASQENHSLAPAIPPVKRKRGRPRKDESIRHTQASNYQLPQVNLAPTSSDSLVGQRVSGVLSGTFGAGYLLSVQVRGTGSTLQGIVFEPSKYSQVTEQNDIAPLVRMYGRHGNPSQMTEIRGQVVQSRTQAPVTISAHPVPNNTVPVQPLRSFESANLLIGPSGSMRRGMPNDADNLNKAVASASGVGSRPGSSTSVVQKPINAEQMQSQSTTVHVLVKHSNKAPPVPIPASEGQTSEKIASGRGNALARSPGNVDGTTQSVEGLEANTSVVGTLVSRVQEPQHHVKQEVPEDGSESHVDELTVTGPVPDSLQILVPQVDSKGVQVCKNSLSGSGSELPSSDAP